ncbi:MAG: hypothetical protein EBU90_16025 [Proteobacteria bacterium]|nr:hypothetical protein [Pseudomonadota bacterium]
MAEFSVNNPNGYLAGPLGSFRVYGADGRLKAIGAGGGGGATWGTITGDILNQTDLIDYITNHSGTGYVPDTRNITINGTTFDLSADRSWSVGTVTSVGGTGTVSGLTLSGSVTTSGNLTLGGTLALTQSDITTGLGYTPYNATNPNNYINQTTANTLYYPLSTNPSNYLTSGTAGLLYYPLSTNPAGYLTAATAGSLYQPIFTTQNGLTYSSGFLELGGTLVKNTTIDGNVYKYDFNFTNVDSSVNTVSKLFSVATDYSGNNALISLDSDTNISTFSHEDAGSGNISAIELLGTEMRIKTPAYTTATIGDVLTLLDNTTGATEWQTPTGGSGGLAYGGAIQVSAGVYEATITGVTAYTALNINSLGALNIYKNTSIPLSSGDIKAGKVITVTYDGSNFQAIGLVNNQLLAYVHNAEGAVINKGQVVYAYQATGNKMSVKLANNTSDTTSAKTIGMVYDTSIAVGAAGYIIIQGVIEGVNTSAFLAGNTLYLGATNGSVTATKPVAPNHMVYVGIVERANAGNGQIYVRCQNGYELDEIHDVLITSPANRNTLFYDSSTQLWVNRGIQAADIPSVTSNATFGVTVDGGGGVITTGVKGYVKIPYACTITGWTVMSTISGSITFDIWKSNSGLPTVANTIIGAGGTKPFLSSQTLRNSSSLSNWTLSVAANDYIAFNVDSATTVTWAIIQIFVTK